MPKVLHCVAPDSKPGTTSVQFHLKPQCAGRGAGEEGKKHPGKNVGREGRDPRPLVGWRTRTCGRGNQGGQLFTQHH